MQQAANIRIKKLMAPSAPLKRNIAYKEEEIEVACKKLREVDIVQLGIEGVMANDAGTGETKPNKQGGNEQTMQEGSGEGSQEERVDSEDNNMWVD